MLYRFLANASQASRKDARNAVKAARSAFAGWSGRTAYNRGQVVYRVAEVLEGRRAQFEAELRAAEGLSASKATTFVDAAVDRLVWYAGWADKVAQVVGGANDVAGPYFNHSGHFRGWNCLQRRFGKLCSLAIQTESGPFLRQG